MEPYSGVVEVILEGFKEKYKNISLTEAARLQGLSTGLDVAVVKTCNCSGVCKNDGRCKCWTSGPACGSHCHLKLKKKLKNVKIVNNKYNILNDLTYFEIDLYKFQNLINVFI